MSDLFLPQDIFNVILYLLDDATLFNYISASKFHYEIANKFFWRIKCDDICHGNSKDLLDIFVRPEEQYDELYKEIYSVLITKNPLVNALRKGKLSLVKFISKYIGKLICSQEDVDNGLIIEVRDPLTGTYEYQNAYNVAKLAIKHNRLDVFTWLYKNGYAKDICSSEHQITSVSAKFGHLDTLKELINMGAPIIDTSREFSTKTRYDTIHHAAINCHFHIVDYLLELNEYGHVDYLDFRLLIVACEAGYIHLAKYAVNQLLEITHEAFIPEQNYRYFINNQLYEIEYKKVLNVKGKVLQKFIRECISTAIANKNRNIENLLKITLPSFWK